MRFVNWGTAALLVCLQLSTAQASTDVPSFDSYKANAISSDGKLLDRHGNVLTNVRIDTFVRRLDWVGLEDVSPAFINALLLAEDQRFYSHQGVDWLGLAHSIWNNLNQSKTRGASSISMQVAAQLNPELARGQSGRTPVQKLQQIQAALALESKWRKQDILEAYFNTVYFRGELQGLAAASWGLFQKAPSGLNHIESALLAALIRAPNASAAKVSERACLIVQAKDKSTPCERSHLQAMLSNATLKPSPTQSRAPHLAAQLISAKSPVVHTSLDGVLQQRVTHILQAQVANLVHQGGQDGAAVVLDNITGEVLAYVGSSGSFSQATWVDAVRAPRQAGSTLKPFLYGLAIDQRRLTAASVLSDTPLSINTAAGLYSPHNYDEQFVGDVSVRRALASSLNIPAVRAWMLLPPDALHHWMLSAGFSTLHQNAEHYGPSLALGSADVTLIDLTNAYRALANLGLYSAWRLSTNSDKQHQKRVLSLSAAWIIGNILSDNAARSHTFGFDSVLATPIWTAVKTGTSKDMRDNWCIGYSQHYTVGVWVGNAFGMPMQHVSGVSGAAPAWAHIMQHLHKVRSSRAPMPPKDLIERRISFETEIEPARTDWFIASTAPSLGEQNTALIQLAHNSQAGTITAPKAGALFAWDPDIPAEQQGIVLKHAGAPEGSYWVVNGHPIAGDTVLWLRDKVRGKSSVALMSKQGVILDSVQFELRGMQRVP